MGVRCNRIIYLSSVIRISKLGCWERLHIYLSNSTVYERAISKRLSMKKNEYTHPPYTVPRGAARGGRRVGLGELQETQSWAGWQAGGRVLVVSTHRSACQQQVRVCKVKSVVREFLFNSLWLPY